MIISIIVPIYGVEPYIKKCLISIMSQSLTSGVECILVNDCTKDESINIAQKLIDEHKGNIKFRIINREENGGLSAARNTGILEAKGDYLYFLDSDDYITPDCIKVLAETVQKFPKAQIVQAGAEATTKGFEYLSLKSTKLKEYTEDKRYIKREMLMAHYPPTAWNKLIKRDWLLKHNFFSRKVCFMRMIIGISSPLNMLQRMPFASKILISIIFDLAASLRLQMNEISSLA